MDPVLISLPEIILNEEPDYNHSPHYHQPLRSLPREQLDTVELSELSLRMSHETIGPVEQFCPSGPRLAMDESPSQRTSKVVEMLQTTCNSLQKTDTLCDPNLIEPKAQDGPFPLNLQTLSPFARHQPVLLPEIICTPCSPQDSCLLNMSPVASTSKSPFGFSSYVLVPVSSPEFWCDAHVPPQPLVALPEVRPSWCFCPETGLVHQHCCHDLVFGRAQQVSGLSAASGKEQNEEQAKSKEELQQNNTPATKFKGSPPSLDEESVADCAFDEYMAIMDFISPKIPEEETTRENESEEDEDDWRLEIENGSFLDYLDELCSDEEFVGKVDSTLNTHYLDAFLSADLDPNDLTALEKEVQYLDSLLRLDQEAVDHLPYKELQQEQPLEVLLQQHLHSPAGSNGVPVTEVTNSRLQGAQSPILDPPCTKSETNPNHDGQNAPLSTRNIGSNEGWTCCSPILYLVPLEEPLPTDATAKYYKTVDAMDPFYYDGSIFKDYNFNSASQLFANIFPDTSHISDSEARDNDALAEEPAAIVSTADVSEDATMSLSNNADTQSAETSLKFQEGPLPGDHPVSDSPSTSSDSGSRKDPHAIVVKDPEPSLKADLLTVSPPQSASPPAPSVLASPPAQMRELEEQCSPRKPSCLEDYTVPVPANSSFVADSLAESCDPPVDGSLSDSVPEQQTTEPPKELQVSQEFASSGISSGEWGERKCENNQGKGGTTVTQKVLAIKARKEGRTNKVQIRRSQRLSCQIEKEKTRLTGEFKTARAKTRKPGEKGVKETAKSTPERNVVTHEKQERQSSNGRQLSKRGESNFEECSQATKTDNTTEQFSNTGEMEQHQKLTGETEKLKVEGEEECEASDPNVSTEIGAENALLTNMAQEEKRLEEARVKRKEEGIQTSSFVSRKTRSMTTEEQVQLTTLPATRARGKIQHSEMERRKIKSSLKKETQDKVSGDCRTDSLSKSSPQSSGVQTDTPSTRDSINESPGEQPLNDRNETPSAKSSENNPHLILALCPETQQQIQKVTLSEGGATGSKPRNFYCLRSQTHKPNVSEGPVNRTGAAEAKPHRSILKPGPDQTADEKGEDKRINGEQEESPSLTSSPVKRHLHERGASEERETGVNETEVISSSPIKRGRWKRRAEVDEGRDSANEKDGAQDELETSGCKPSPPLTRSNRKAKDDKVSNLSKLSGQETFGGGESSAMESRKGTHIPCFPCKRQTRCSKQLPSKYKDFILCSTNRQRTAEKRKEDE